MSSLMVFTNPSSRPLLFDGTIDYHVTNHYLTSADPFLSLPCWGVSVKDAKL
ncbi:hypothetical protein [Alicyclobacillus tolerans]|uniref:hypothetical protein n=1 Tax=Alicyclobacillus tolerans TaxID=90970 RepID=UPI001A9759A4|nr:hypothetical protein [Alicyclobacillus montanus]